MVKSCCYVGKKSRRCKRKDGKIFNLPRRFSRKKCKQPKGFTMRSSCAPYKFCSKKQKGGKTVKNKLPKLRKLSKENKRHHYKLSDPQRKRILAINEGVRSESKKTGKNMKKAAISKKARFNVLRIYRKNKKKDECRKITRDMKYMDKKYKLGKTKDICGN